MRNSCAIVVGGVVGAAALPLVVAADVTLGTAARSLEVWSYGGPTLRSDSAARGSFSASLMSEGFAGDGHERSASAGRLDSSIESRGITFDSGIACSDGYTQGGVGGGSGRSVLEISFTVAGVQRYDFYGVVSFETSGPWVYPGLEVSLTGAGGTVFSMGGASMEPQRFGGVLAAGEYHFRIQHDFAYGGIGAGEGEGTFFANLTVPTPAGLAVIALAAAGRRRRR